MKGALFTWMIGNFSTLTAPETEEKLKSDPFVMYGHEWNIWLHPKSSKGKHLGLFLGLSNPSSLPAGWNVFADFCLAVVNHSDKSQTLRKRSQPEWYFNDQVHKRGWDDFAVLSKLHDPAAGFLVDGTLTVEAQITVKPHLSAPTKTPVQEFAPLFDHIHKVVAASPPSAVSSRGTTTHSGGHRARGLMSLSKHEADDSPFPGLIGSSSRLGPLQLFDQFIPLAAKCSPHQASGSELADLCSQFRELCQPYASNLAVLDATQLFFDSKDDTLSSLKRMDDGSRKIKKCIDDVGKEIERVEGQLRKLKDAEARLSQEYAAVGKKSERLKAEWDEIAAKIEDMTAKRERAEQELAEIEAKWNSFVRMVNYI